jgi:RHS repeat-associated protein
LRGKVVTAGGVSRRTCYAYDVIGNQISVTTPRAALSSCPNDAPSSAAAFTTSYRFDAARQLVGVISAPAGGLEAIRNTYDPEGRITTIEHGTLSGWQSPSILPSSWGAAFNGPDVTDKTYDVMGRILTEKRSGGTPTLTQYSYDSLGRRECTAVRMNPSIYGSLPAPACALGAQGVNGPDRITRLSYDAASHVLTEVRAYGTSLQQTYAAYGYTPDGRQDWVEDANGNHTDFMYDGFDRLYRMYFPQTAVGAHAENSSDYEQYGYDNNHNRTMLRLRSGETISYSYDALNRLYLKDLPGTTVGDVAYGYDLMSHDLYAKFASGYGITNNIVNGFGEVRQMTSTSATDSFQLNFDYDEESNRTRVTWPDGVYVQYTYDGLNRMDQVRENGATAPPGLLADYSYDTLGRRSNIYRGNSTTSTLYYDGAIPRLQNVVQDLASTAGDVTFGLGYNNAGQVISRTVSNDSYSYFSLPNSKAYSPDGLNRYSSVAGVTFAYDARGNLTSDGSRSFSYDYENHLLTVSGSGAVTLDYDPFGRLQKSTSGGATTRYLYAGSQLIAEYNGSTMLRRYVHGASTDDPLVWYETSALTDRRWLHTDQQGSIVATSDGTGAGTVYAYGAYGEPAYDNWSGSRFRYTGQITLPEAKLYHYKARVYDPQLGRFLQTDPVGYEADLNLYAYVGNDPLDKTDPLGLFDWEAFWEGFAAGGENMRSGVPDHKFASGSWERTLGYSIGGGLNAVAEERLGQSQGMYAGQFRGKVLTLKYKEGWSASQRAAADKKVGQLDAAARNGEVKPSTPERSGTSARKRFEADGGQVAKGEDVDHIVDLQLLRIP